MWSNASRMRLRNASGRSTNVNYIFGLLLMWGGGCGGRDGITHTTAHTHTHTHRWNIKGSRMTGKWQLDPKVLCLFPLSDLTGNRHTGRILATAPAAWWREKRDPRWCVCVCPYGRVWMMNCEYTCAFCQLLAARRWRQTFRAKHSKSQDFVFQFGKFLSWIWGKFRHIFYSNRLFLWNTSAFPSLFCQ